MYAVPNTILGKAILSQLAEEFDSVCNWRWNSECPFFFTLAILQTAQTIRSFYRLPKPSDPWLISKPSSANGCKFNVMPTLQICRALPTPPAAPAWIQGPPCHQLPHQSPMSPTAQWHMPHSHRPQCRLSCSPCNQQTGSPTPRHTPSTGAGPTGLSPTAYSHFGGQC